MGGNTSSSMPAVSGKTPTPSPWQSQTPPLPSQYAPTSWQQAPMQQQMQPFNYFQSRPVYGPTNPANIQASAEPPVPNNSYASSAPGGALPTAAGKLSTSSSIPPMVSGKLSNSYASGGAANGLPPERLNEIIKKIMEG